MASSINRVVLLGNIGTDPEVREINGGVKVARFRLATTRKWKDAQGEKREASDWHSIKCFGTAAEYAERFLGKGVRVCLEGSLREEQWESNGQKRSAVYVYADQFVPFSPMSREGDTGQRQEPARGNATTQRAAAATAPPSRQPEPQGRSAPDWEDDIPF